MAEQQIKPKARRKLNRSQIIDILERNIELYKGEELFVHYLVELAIYLMEYEYNWEHSDVEMPDLPEGPPDGPRPKIEKKENKVIVSMLTTTSQRSQKRHFCPFCGTEVAELLICPSCRNLTR